MHSRYATAQKYTTKVPTESVEKDLYTITGCGHNAQGVVQALDFLYDVLVSSMNDLNRDLPPSAPYQTFFKDEQYMS